MILRFGWNGCFEIFLQNMRKTKVSRTNRTKGLEAPWKPYEIKESLARPTNNHPRALQEGKNVSQNNCSLDYQAPTHKGRETPQEAQLLYHQSQSKPPQPPTHARTIKISSLNGRNHKPPIILVCIFFVVFFCVVEPWHAFGFNVLTEQTLSFELCDVLIHVRLSFLQQ